MTRTPHPAYFVVAYTFGLVGVLAATGFAAVDLGLNPAWLLVAASVVIALGALVVVEATQKAPKEI